NTDEVFGEGFIDPRDESLLPVCSSYAPLRLLHFAAVRTAYRLPHFLILLCSQTAVIRHSRCKLYKNFPKGF
ncbi:MAG: hypothetical protein IJ339_03900, partial [Oscillospiraceae bacterium]|nr:hypothetical protein [Oscillospiraceae bacterium]